MKKLKEFIDEYMKRPYMLTNKQVEEMSVLLHQFNLPKISDKKCGVCLKRSVEILIDYYQKNKPIELKKKKGRPSKKEKV